jgi:dienelactone hydrolase
MVQRPAGPAAAGVVVLHGAGGNFYSSTLFDAVGERLVERGLAVLRVNTRGHDGISTAVTAQGGRRQGAAYEIVDDCRHDVTAWVDFLRQQVGPRVLLLGHSLGAVKAIYAAAHEPRLDLAAVIALSPPRLAYSVLCSNPDFLASFQRAEQLVADGQPGALLEVKVPLPFVITAAGYVEKYGPEERYDFTRHLSGVACPVLATFGELEVASNLAFRGVPQALAEDRRLRRLHVAVLPGADHFYTGRRAELTACVDTWLQEHLA